jgi:hypothetical protein
VTKQTDKDREATKARVQRNQVQWKAITPLIESHFGPKPRRKALLTAARAFKTLTLDRLAKRSLPAICRWFCENWQQIAPDLETVVRQPPVPVLGLDIDSFEDDGGDFDDR